MIVVLFQPRSTLLWFTCVMHCRIWEPHTTAVFLLIHICDVHLMVGLQLTASPTYIRVCTLQHRLMSGWLPVIHPGGLLSIHSPLTFWSPCFVMMAPAIWDLLTLSYGKRWALLGQKCKIEAIKSCTYNQPHPLAALITVLSRKGSIRGKRGESYMPAERC